MSVIKLWKDEKVFFLFSSFSKHTFLWHFSEREVLLKWNFPSSTSDIFQTIEHCWLIRAVFPIFMSNLTFILIALSKENNARLEVGHSDVQRQTGDYVQLISVICPQKAEWSFVENRHVIVKAQFPEMNYRTKN